MLTMLSPSDSASFKVVFPRSCTVIGLALLLLIPMAGLAVAQSAPAENDLISGDEGIKIGSITWSHSARDPVLYSKTYSEVAYDSSRRPFSVESFLASGTSLSLADRAPLENSEFQDPSQESFQDKPQTRDPDDWYFVLTPYLWLPAMSGDSTVKGNKTHVGMTISDVVSSATFGFFNYFRAQKGRFFIQQGGMYTVIEDDGIVGNFKVETESTQGLLDLALGYRVLEGEVNPEDGHKIMLDLYGGVRYQYLKTEVEISPITNVDESHDWIELLVGVALDFEITKSFRWSAARFDLSGFGIGSASDLTTNFYTGVAYFFNEDCALNIGYRIYNLDYDRGSGSSRYSQDYQLNGPMIGVTFLF